MRWLLMNFQKSWEIRINYIKKKILSLFIRALLISVKINPKSSHDFKTIRVFLLRSNQNILPELYALVFAHI